MIRASAVVNCQFDAVPFAIPSRRGEDPFEFVDGPDPLIEALAPNDRCLALGHVEPAAVLYSNVRVSSIAVQLLSGVTSGAARKASLTAKPQAVPLLPWPVLGN